MQEVVSNAPSKMNMFQNNFIAVHKKRKSKKSKNIQRKSKNIQPGPGKQHSFKKKECIPKSCSKVAQKFFKVARVLLRQHVHSANSILFCSTGAV